MTPRFNYLELPTDDIERSREFYRQSFGWDFTAFGPSYSATVSDDTDVGLDASPDKNLTSALPVIEVADLDAVFARALSPDPGRRFPNAKAFADALKASIAV